ncbi:hypothetical protein GGQ08_003056 [Salinibacter ruber]|uniref:hypothetical protein n=2 Tax=Salinibacter ruber TaxID=146919 RepID=UPI002168325E|nr:hypothetical protein [Salinibacter ruber]MCS3651091.1 hypothetical protein [Salinibacter ruber]MCS3654980.1 hypothetical protein [Salinibacter ruber]
MNTQVMQRIILFIFAVAMVGCGPTGETTTTSNTSYEAESFSPDELRQKGLAIMPIQSDQGVEGFRRPFGNEINKTARSTLSNAEVITWEESQQIINDAGLVEDYRETIRSYEETSILNQEAVQQIGEAVGKRYLLVVTLGPPQQESEYVDEGVSVETRSVSAYGKVWDAAKGDIAWEGIATTATEGVPIFGQEVEGTTQSRAQRTSEALMRRVMGMNPL